MAKITALSSFRVEVRRVFCALVSRACLSLLKTLNADLLSSENIEWAESVVLSDVMDEILFWCKVE